MKIYLKTYPVPPSRLRLTWSFDNCQSLWEHFHLLKHFSCSWEILDCVISAKASDRCFIFAQISGLQEEMESFSKVCPGISYATQKGEREQMKRYLQQLGLKAILSGADQQLKAGEYLWIQEGGEKVWLLSGKQCDISDDCSSQWKKRLMTSLQ